MDKSYASGIIEVGNASQSNIGTWQIILKDFQNVAPNSHVWNEETFRLFGYHPGSVEVSLDLLFAHVHEDDLLLLQKAFERSIKDCTPFDLKYRIICKDGTLLLVHATASCEYYFGSRQWVKFSGIIKAISGSENTENRSDFMEQLLSGSLSSPTVSPSDLDHILTSSERIELERIYYPDLVSKLQMTQWHLMESQRIAHIGSWQIIMKDVSNVVPGSLQWSDEIFRIFGYEPNEFAPSIDLFIQHILPDDQQKVIENLYCAMAGYAEFEFEFRGMKKDGREIIAHVKGECSAYLGAADWVKIIGTVRDITAQKKAQRYEASLRSIFDNTSLSYVLLDMDLNILLFNQAAYKGTMKYQGLALEEGRSVLHYTSAERREAVVTLYQSVLAGKTHSYEVNFRYQGKTCYFQIKLFPVSLSGDSVSGMVVSTEDITESKESEDNIKAKRAKYQAMFDHSDDAILITECDGNVLDANPAACALFRMSVEELCAAGRLGLVDANHPNILPLLRERQRTGRAKGELVFMRKDGSRFPGILTSIAYTDTNGRKCSSMIVRDITGQRIAEDAMRQKNEQLHELLDHINNIREDERTTLAREIHDELGQQLTTLKMGVRLFKDKLARHGLSDPSNEALLDEIQEAIKSVRKIATSLRPVILDYEGLGAAMMWYAGEFEKKHQIQVRLDLELCEEIADKKIAITLFRVFQESLTNILRHADASEVNVTLKTEEGNILLSIADNGKGIDPDALKSRKTFGLTSMQERVSAIGGQFMVSNNEPCGTISKVVTPVNPPQRSRNLSGGIISLSNKKYFPYFASVPKTNLNDA